MSQIYELMPKISAAIGAIGKNRQNESGPKFWFRGIDDIYNAAHKPLIDNGVFVTSEVSDLKREERTTAKGSTLFYSTLLLKVTFWAPDGSSVTTTTAGEAMDSGDKATNKAMSAALKYAFFQTFCIPLESVDDADSETHKDIVPRNGHAEDRQEFKPATNAYETFCQHLDILFRNYAPEKSQDDQDWIVGQAKVACGIPGRDLATCNIAELRSMYAEIENSLPKRNGTRNGVPQEAGAMG